MQGWPDASRLVVPNPARTSPLSESTTIRPATAKQRTGSRIREDVRHLINKILRDRWARTHKLAVLLRDRALQPQMCYRSGQSPLPKRNSRGAAVSREDGRLMRCHGSSRREGRKEGSRGCRSAGSEGPDKGNARAASLHARSSIRQTAIRSVTRIEVRIARSRLPIAVSVIIATTGTRIVAPAEWDADTDAKVRTSPEASTVVIASAGLEPTRVVSASAAVVAAPAGIAAAHVRRGIAAPARIGTARVGSSIAAPTAGIATARVRRGRIATSTAA